MEPVDILVWFWMILLVTEMLILALDLFYLVLSNSDLGLVVLLQNFHLQYFPLSLPLSLLLKIGV